MTPRLEIQIFDHPTQLIHDATQRLVFHINHIVATKGYARIILTGGTNGIAVLKELNSYIDDIAWDRVYFYFGDERFLPADHPDRNSKQAYDALFYQIPQARVYPIPSSEEMTISQAADHYLQLLLSLEEDSRPYWDIHLMGMGDEGHINSLFPHSNATLENKLWVVPVTDSPKPPAERITLTFPAIRYSQQVWFLVTGKSKAAAVKHSITGNDYHQWPAAGVQGKNSTVWFIDNAAATDLIPGLIP